MRIVSVVAAAGRIDYQEARQLDICIRCDGKKEKRGNVLCDKCFNLELQGDDSLAVLELRKQIESMQRKMIIQPMKVEQDLIEKCGRCGWKVPEDYRRTCEKKGLGYFCPRCKNSLVASVTYRNARIGNMECKGPKAGKQIFLTQKDLGPETWEKDGAPGQSRLANYPVKFTPARADGGKITPAEGDVIVQCGNKARAVNIRGAKNDVKALQNAYRAVKLALRATVERNFFVRFTGVADSVQVPAAESDSEGREGSIINSESVKVSVPSNTRVEGLQK